MPSEKRGIIHGFTPAARIRMLKTIARIDWFAVGKSIMITLTYPDNRKDRTYQERTTDRTLFLKAIEKNLGRKVSALWRTEWKARKSGKAKGQIAPHLHLVMLGEPFICQRFVRQVWRKILKVTGPLATHVSPTADGEHSAKYASKYAAKETVSALDNVAYLELSMGRAWGLTRKSAVPFCKKRISRRMSQASIDRAMSVAADILGRKYVGTFFALNPHARNLFEKITTGTIRVIDAAPGRG